MAADRFDDTNKQACREQIWRIIARETHPPLARVLHFPGTARHELDVMLSRGFRPENIFMVEKNPAVKAIFTRRARDRILPPPSNFYRMLLSEASEKLSQRGICLDAAHLDFCANCTSNEMFSEIKQFYQSGICKENALVAITILTGREHDIDFIRGTGIANKVTDQDSTRVTRFNQFSTAERGRIYRIWQTLGVKMTLMEFGKYLNMRTHNPMIWTVFRINRLPTNKPTP